jgi:hypothetical protein
VTKQYQTEEMDTSTLAVPEAVTIAMGEIAEDMGGGLLALAVGTGLQVMASLMEADVSAVCGPAASMTPSGSRCGAGAGRSPWAGARRR